MFVSPVLMILNTGLFFIVAMIVFCWFAIRGKKGHQIDITYECQLNYYYLTIISTLLFAVAKDILTIRAGQI